MALISQVWKRCVGRNDLFVLFGATPFFFYPIEFLGDDFNQPRDNELPKLEIPVTQMSLSQNYLVYMV